jgi:hypothetical protein
VWEVIAVAQDNDGDVERTSAYLEMPLDQVQAAASYYNAHQREIDERIERNRWAAEEAHAAFLAVGQTLGRRRPAHPGENDLDSGEDWL